MDAPLWFALWLTVPPLLVAGGALGASRLEAARERRRHRRAVAALGPPVTRENFAGIAPRSVVTLEGTLVAQAPLVSFHPFGTSFFDEPNVYAVTQLPAAGEIAIDLEGGGRATLDGATQVVVGAAETAHETPLERARSLGAETLAVAKVRAQAGQFRIVRAGDRVRVRGVVVPAPDDDALYRARSTALRMSPETPDSAGTPVAIPICATSTVERRRMGISRPLIATIAAAVALGGAGAALGQRARRTPETADLTRASLPPEPPPCRQEVVSLLERDAEEARSIATRCSDAWAMAHVHFAAGEFREASTAFDLALAKDPSLAPSLTEAEAHLFAHAYPSTTATVERMVRHFYPGPSTAEKRDLECIVNLLRARAGSGGKEPLEPGNGDHGYRRICSTRPFVKFARDLDSEGSFGGGDGDDWRAWINGVYRPEAAFDPVLEPRTAAFGTRSRLLARPVGIERRTLDRLRLAELLGSSSFAEGSYGRFAAFQHPSDYVVQTTSFAAELTLFYAFSGFPERAQPYWPILDRVAEIATAEKVFHRGPSPAFTSEKKALEDERALVEWEMSVAAAAALLAGDITRMERYASAGEPHSRTVVVQLERMLRPGAPWEHPDEDGYWPPNAPIFAAGRAGDGAELVKELVAQKVTGRSLLARLLPSITRNRAALDAWFRSPGYPATCITCGGSSHHGHLSDRREVARILGQAAEHDRLRLAASGFTDALTDPDIAFDVDELETFFHRKH